MSGVLQGIACDMGGCLRRKLPNRVQAKLGRAHADNAIILYCLKVNYPGRFVPRFDLEGSWWESRQVGR